MINKNINAASMISLFIKILFKEYKPSYYETPNFY